MPTFSLSDSRQYLNRDLTAALLASSFVWVLPWSRSFLLSVVVLAITSLALLVRRRADWWAAGAGIWCSLNLLAALALLLSAAASAHPEKPLELAVFQLVLMLAGMPLLLWARDRHVWQQIQICLLAFIGFWLVDGLVQALAGTDLFGIDRVERLGSFFSHPHKFGFYIAFLCTWVLFSPVVRRLSLPLQALVLLLCLAVTFYGNTRAGWMNFALVCAVWAYLTRDTLRKSPLLIGAIAIGIAIAGWLIATDEHVSQRIAASIPSSFDLDGLRSIIPVRAQLWEQAWWQFTQNPWFGTGAGNFSLYLPEQWQGTRFEQPYAHHVIMEILAGVGTVGSLLYLAVTLWFLRLVWRGNLSKQPEAERPIAPLLTLLCLWLPVNTHRELFSSELMVVTWLSVALVIARLQPAPQFFFRIRNAGSVEAYE